MYAFSVFFQGWIRWACGSDTRRVLIEQVILVWPTGWTPAFGGLIVCGGV